MNWLDAEIAARVGNETKDWEEREVAAFLRKQAERQEQFFTIGDFPVKRVYTAADIAAILCLSERTVGFHICSCFKKLGVNNKIAAVLCASKAGLF